MAIILYLAFAVVLYYVATAVAAWYPLRHFQGPFLGKFSFLWEARAAWTGRAVQIYADVIKEHGQLARIAPDVLLTDDPETMRRMSSARNAYRRSEWYTSFRLDARQHSMFSTPDAQLHDDLKARTAAGYSGRDVPGLEADVDDILGRLRHLIRDKYLSTAKGGARPMDFSDVTQWFTLDSLGRIAYGMDLGHLEADQDVHSILSATHAVAPFVQLCTEVPYIRNIVFSDFIIRLVGPKATDPGGIGKLQGFAKSIVSQRFGREAEQTNDMLGSFVRHGLTELQCENETLLQFVAGSDTTATTIRTTMLYLMTNVVVYKRLQAEIDQGIRDGQISSPITNAEAKTLPYLQAVILEGMRIHPGNSAPFLKVVPPGGDVLCGRKVPGGTQIATSLWSTLRRKDIFGEDAEVFRPERWLDAGLDPVRKAEMAKVVDLNFGFGRWGCAGKQIALMELNKVFVELLRYFDFQLVDPARPWKAYNHSLFYFENMWVTVTARELS